MSQIGENGFNVTFCGVITVTAALPLTEPVHVASVIAVSVYVEDDEGVTTKL